MVLCLVEVDVDAAVEGLEAELAMVQWVVYLLSSVNFCCGAPDLVTTTFVQRDYWAENFTFFLSVW